MVVQGQNIRMNIVVYQMENKDNVFWRITTEIKTISINQGMTIFSKECIERPPGGTYTGGVWRFMNMQYN